MYHKLQRSPTIHNWCVAVFGHHDAFDCSSHLPLGQNQIDSVIIHQLVPEC